MYDQRASERFNCEAPVTIESCETGKNYDGTLYNYSRDGLYLELDYPFSQGTEIRVLIKEDSDFSSPKQFQAKVIWCEEILGAVVLYNFGIGVLCDPAFRNSSIAERFQVIDGGANKK